MKKLYFLAIVFSIGIVTNGMAQFVASTSGNWSSSLTWAPNPPPSTVCNNCTIRINSGVNVQLDQHVELTGSSILYMGNGDAGVAQITIGNSSQTTITSGFNIVLDTLPGNSVIVMYGTNSKIDASGAGSYDGIFVGPLPNSIYQKVIGTQPSLFQGNTVIGSATPAYGLSLSGPVTLFSGGTLPITLTSFSALLSENVVNVNWSVDQQVNFSHFVVLRSGDGTTWETIGQVNGKPASSGAADYAFTDGSPLHGNNYYRLKAIDMDGIFRLSEVKYIKGLFAKGILFANPVRNNNLSVTFGSDVNPNLTIRLLNQNGQILQQRQLSNAQGATTIFAVGNYTRGVYLLHVKAADGSQNIYKVVISN